VRRGGEMQLSILQWQQITWCSISQLHLAVILTDCSSCNGACRDSPPSPLSWMDDNGRGPASGDVTVSIRRVREGDG